MKPDINIVPREQQHPCREHEGQHSPSMAMHVEIAEADVGPEKGGMLCKKSKGNDIHNLF